MTATRSLLCIRKALNKNYPEIILFLLVFSSYLYPLIRNPYLISNAGLYMEMVEGILKNRFMLPSMIPYYGPGGIPFAYPPLGFYISALTIKIFHVSIIQYVRFAPIIFYTGALVAFYFLVRNLTHSRAKGMFSAFLYGTSLVGYLFHAQESGMIRGLALLFAMVGLVAFQRVFFESQKQKRDVFIGTLCLAGTALTHFTYLIFFIVSILMLFFFSREQISKRIIKFCLMCSSAALLTTPWLITILTRHGFSPFFHADGTHGGVLNFLGFLKNPASLVDVLDIFFEGPFSSSLGTSGLLLIGLCYLLFKNKWFLPVWFLAVFLFVGESARFQFLIGSVLAAEVVIDVFDHLKPGTFRISIPQSVLRTLPVLLLLSFYFGMFFIALRQFKSLDFPNLIALSDWFQENTGEEATYLFLSSDVPSTYSYTENMPYFLKRTPEILLWGSEWTSAYEAELSIRENFNACMSQDSIECVDSLIYQEKLSPDYLIAYNENTSITRHIKDSDRWVEQYRNPKFVVYRSEPDGSD